MGSIKATEIKIELALKNDIIKAGNLSNTANSDGLRFASSAAQSFLAAVKASDDVIALANKAILQAKDLGVDSKYFEDLRDKGAENKALFTKRMNAVSKI